MNAKNGWNVDVYPHQKMGDCSDCGAKEIKIYQMVPANPDGECKECLEKALGFNFFQICSDCGKEIS